MANLCNRISQAAKTVWKNTTLEPVLLMFSFGWAIEFGVRVQTNLLMWKVCHVELEYNETICDNLSEGDNDQYQSQVQRRVNDFQMLESWIARVPTLVYSLFAGSLSDDFGRKPLIIFPILGTIIGIVFKIVNFAFIESLPTQFFYITDSWWNFFGGNPIYYLGIYGYGATITNPEQRVKLLARFDSMDLIGTVLGTMASPVVFEKLGYNGSFGINLGLTTLAFLYVIFLISEPVNRKTPEPFSGMANWIRTYLLTPCWQMLKALFRQRPGHLRQLLIIQIVCYACLWFNYEYQNIEYLYLLKVLDGYTETEYAYYYAINSIAWSLFILFILPLINLHPISYILLALPGQALTFFLATWMKVSWQYYIIQVFSIASYGVWSSARTLFTYCVEANDIGKIYAAVGIIAALAPLASNPAYRQLYSLTLDTFPGAFSFLAGSVAVFMVFLYAIIHAKKSHLLTEQAKEDDDVQSQNI